MTDHTLENNSTQLDISNTQIAASEGASMDFQLGHENESPEVKKDVETPSKSIWPALLIDQCTNAGESIAALKKYAENINRDLNFIQKSKTNALERISAAEELLKIERNENKLLNGRILTLGDELKIALNEVMKLEGFKSEYELKAERLSNENTQLRGEVERLSNENIKLKEEVSQLNKKGQRLDFSNIELKSEVDQ